MLEEKGDDGNRRRALCSGDTPISNSNIFKGWSGAGIRANLAAARAQTQTERRSARPRFPRHGWGALHDKGHFWERRRGKQTVLRGWFGAVAPFPYGRHIKGRSPGESNRCFLHADRARLSLPPIPSSPRCFSFSPPSIPPGLRPTPLQRARAGDVELKPLHDSLPLFPTLLLYVDFLPKYYKRTIKGRQVGAETLILWFSENSPDMKEANLVQYH